MLQKIKLKVLKKKITETYINYNMYNNKRLVKNYDYLQNLPLVLRMQKKLARLKKENKALNRVIVHFGESLNKTNPVIDLVDDESSGEENIVYDIEEVDNKEKSLINIKKELESTQIEEREIYKVYAYHGSWDKNTLSWDTSTKVCETFTDENEAVKFYDSLDVSKDDNDNEFYKYVGKELYIDQENDPSPFKSQWMDIETQFVSCDECPTIVDCNKNSIHIFYKSTSNEVQDKTLCGMCFHEKSDELINSGFTCVLPAGSFLLLKYCAANIIGRESRLHDTQTQ